MAFYQSFVLDRIFSDEGSNHEMVNKAFFKKYGASNHPEDLISVAVHARLNIENLANSLFDMYLIY